MQVQEQCKKDFCHNENSNENHKMLPAARRAAWSVGRWSVGGYRWVVVRWVSQWVAAVGGVWQLWQGGYAASIRNIKLLTTRTHGATHSNGYSIATSVQQLKRFKNKRMRLITVRIVPYKRSRYVHIYVYLHKHPAPTQTIPAIQPHAQ